MVTLVMVFGVSSCSLPPNQNHDRSNSVQTKTKWMNDPKADLNIERGLTAFLNTEVGLVVESDHLQDQITAMLDQYLLQIAYQLQLDENGNIVWYEHKGNGVVVKHHHDPESTRFQCLTMHFVSYFPVEWMM